MISSTQMIRDIWHYVKAYRTSFYLGSFLSTCSSLSWLIIPWAIGKVISISANYTAGSDLNEVWQLLMLIGGIALLYYCTQEVARYLIYMIGERSGILLQEKVLRHISRLDLVWHEQENSGNKLKKITRGGKSLNTLLRLYVDMVIDAVIGLLGVALVFSVLSWKLNLLLWVFFFLHYFLARYLTQRAKDQSMVVNKQEELFSGLKFEMLNHITTIKTMGIIDGLMRYLTVLTKGLVQALSRRIYLFRSRLAILGLNQHFFQIIIIAITVWEVVQGNFEVGVIAHVYIYFGKIQISAQRFSEIYHRWVMAQIDLHGVKQILDAPAKIERMGNIDFDPNWQELRIQDLVFHYQRQPVLKGMNFTIRRGEKIGLVGASGEGKSTLFKLLQKLYDEYEGQIHFDGRSLRDIHRQSFVTEIGVVLQETELFDLSISQNIQLGQEEEASARLIEVAEIARVNAFADQLPDGLDTMVGEKGVKLSGGEKQRVGIARALYRQPGILFLDEATSHLDPESESLIQEALEESMESITAIVIAHRLSTLRKMDRILVIQDGRIVEEGAFEELIQRKGIFQQLWEKEGG